MTARNGNPVGRNHHPVKRDPIPNEIWAESLKHRGMVKKIASFYVGRGLDMEDLIQEGYFGVCRALKTYDTSRGMFYAWARTYVMTAIREALAAGGSCVYVPMFKWAKKTRPNRVDFHNEAVLAFTEQSQDRYSSEQYRMLRFIASEVEKMDKLDQDVFNLVIYGPQGRINKAKTLGMTKYKIQQREAHIYGVLREAATRAAV